MGELERVLADWLQAHNSAAATFAIGLLRLHGYPNVIAALRALAAQPAKILALLML
jgi:hypothetical protein